MKFATPLVEGTLIKRYKRFLADVELEDGAVVTAHCANPGSMMGLSAPGNRVWLSRSDNPKRKLKYSWELLSVDGALVGINTSHPNAIAFEAITDGKIAELTGYESFRREVKYGQSSRIDILLSADDKADCYVEIKNVHLMRQPKLAEFPDSVTKRGAKHLAELADMVDVGHRAVMLYIVQYEGLETMSFARDIDPEYGKAFDEARARGVEAYAYGCSISPREIVLSNALELNP